MNPPAPDLGFVHRFVPAPGPASPYTILLLHGTGGNEDDLLPVGRRLGPAAALLSPRGKVMEHGMPRFFRRVEEGVFDVEDLHARTHELAAFLTAAAAHYGFDLARVVAVGYSNGANIAGSLMLLHPRALAAAVLFRPMVPFVPDSEPDLTHASVLICAGRMDPIVPADHPERLLALLGRCGAHVTARWEQAGHGLTDRELDAARDWLREWSERHPV